LAISWTWPTRVLACVEVVVWLRVRDDALLLRVRLVVERPAFPVDRRVPVLRRVVVGLSAPELLVAICFSAPFWF
jgi:predicted RNA polymerase sigma factor